mmetsp:Transcript_12226/g.25768  ORF Transcript_12226/g.25768 Transcript_12226/m.25768 type:complete len:94 (+) Transcript_12226:1030-1311(+)
MTIIAKEPTTSWTAVSSGPPHLPESLSNIKVNNNGANVPVQPAVKMPTNWAVKMESAKAKLKPPIRKAIDPVTTPMARPRYRAARISLVSQEA